MRKRRAFLWADLHLSHERLCAPRSFATPGDMDEALVAANNAVVSPEDRVYILGDVAMRKSALAVLGRMHGHKVLVKGNHDVLKLRDYLPYFEDIRSVVVLPQERMVLTHIPVHAASLDRWVGNIHGHLHDRKVPGADGRPDPRYLCVSVEQTGFAPMLLEDALARLASQA